MRRLSPWFALALALGACAEASSRDADAGGVTTTSVVEGGAQSMASDASESPAPHVLRGPLPVCTQATGSCPSAWFERQQPLLKASSFGQGAQFVDVGRHAVLLRLSDGSFRVALLPLDEAAPARPMSWPVELGARTPRRVLGALHGIPGFVFVLACTPEDSACAVFRAEGHRDRLSAFQELEPLPAGFVASGLASEIFENHDSAAPCVYGNGLLCLSDGWRESIPISKTLRLNRVAPQDAPRIAVGEQGRWFWRGSDSWSEQEGLGEVSLTQASILNGLAVVVGAGQIQAVVGVQLAKTLPCAAPGQIEALWLSYGGALLQMAGGALISHGTPGIYRKDADCLLYQLPADPVLARSDDSCGLSQNERILHAETLWGDNTCTVE